MRLVTRFSALSAVAAAAALSACGSPLSLLAAAIPNRQDTVTVWAATNTPLDLPSAYVILARQRVRLDQVSTFDFIYDVDHDGHSVLLPLGALVNTGTATGIPGFLLTPTPFDQITAGQQIGYITKDTVPAQVGQVYYARASLDANCGLGVPYYAKIEILSIDVAERSMTFRILTDINCGYRGLELGLPQEVIDVKLVRQDPAGVRAALLRREDATILSALDAVVALDRHWRERVTETEQLKAARNAATEEVARRKRAKEPAEELLASLKTSSERVKALDAEIRDLEEKLQQELLQIPNLPHAGAPSGSASNNRVVREWGTVPSFDFTPKPHWELGETLGILDLARGSKLSGAGFPVFLGAGARLVRGLASFMLDLHTREHGYTEVAPPFVVNRATLTGTGNLPKFEDDLYSMPRDDLFLIPTAEVPVTNLHRDEILDGADLPRTFVAFTPCFRREAGAAGKDTRGLLRVHQFDKVELVRLTRPEASEAEHQLLTGHAETVLQRLELPYRVVELAAGDTGFSAARTYDLEAWAAGVGAWLECSSASTFTDFQARRANIRFRPAPGAKPEFVHTLNASGVAFARTIAALLENNQAADGSVRIPGALAPYVGTDRLRPR